MVSPISDTSGLLASCAPDRSVGPTESGWSDEFQSDAKSPFSKPLSSGTLGSWIAHEMSHASSLSSSDSLMHEVLP